ncbi:hypothetical protein G3M48_008825 [Beauveria asiatica]|uniref:Peptidase S1 domain-containing protein n=1 Tax=Beauveria asiatica TaxID=1069075 RepID=A0AAW0RJN2_9HYPO
MVRKVSITLAVALSAISAAAATIDKRIFGGELAKDGEFPFIVSLQGNGHFCAGSLLDSTTVLTAAHCARDFVLSGEGSVKAGTLDRTTGGVDAEVASAQIKMHPDYALGSPSHGPYAVNDIAILKLATPIKKSGTISYATLPANGSDPVANSIAIVAGWGNQTPNLYPDGKLHKVVIPVHEREVCSNLDPGAAGRDTIVCAGGNGKNVCKYDSGGPLIDQETGQVIGVASFGIKRQCGSETPSVYTRVGSYMTFINENLGGSGSGPSGPTVG